jgi:hypothetical protein
MPDHSSVAAAPKLGQIEYADIGAGHVNAIRKMFRAFDALVMASVINKTTTAPPGSPANGDCYLVAAGATGAWAGKADYIARWSTRFPTDDTNTLVPAWDFYAPKVGMLVYNQADSTFYDYNGATWTPFVSGGGGSGVNAFVTAGPPDAPPVSPTAYDDEFSGTVLDAKWTKVNTGAGSDVIVGNGRAQLTRATGTQVWTLAVQSRPVAPYQIDAKFTLDARLTNYSYCGLVLRDSATGHFVALRYSFENVGGSSPFARLFVDYWNGTGPSQFFGSSTIGSTILPASPVIYLRIKDDGTNFILNYSFDGIQWDLGATWSLGRTVFLPSTYDQMGIGIAADNNTQPAQATCDWFRRTDGGYVPAAVPPIANGFVTAGPPDAPPATSTAMDDEFSGSALDAKWSWVNQGTGTAAVGNGLLTMSLPAGATDNVRMLVQTVPAAPYEVTCKITGFNPERVGSNGNYLGVALYDGTKVSLFCIKYDFTSNSYQLVVANFTNVTTFSAAPLATTISNWRAFPYLRVKVDSTNITFSTSEDGVNFVQQYQALVGNFLGAITKVGIAANCTGNVVSAYSLDWFRRTDGGYTPITVPSVAINADSKPTQPNTLDDEFEKNTLDSKWTLVNQGTATYSLQNGALLINCPTSATENNFLFVQAAPATPWEITAKLSPEGALGGYIFAGLCVRESSTGKFIRFGPQYRQAAPGPGKAIEADNMTNPTTYAGTTALAGFLYEWANALYVRIKDDGTNLIFSTSRNGLTWTQWGTVGRTAHMAGGPNQVGITLGPLNMAVSMAVDWFRRTA